jgi:tetratricopeptide (TPR) repeat protein
LALTCLAASAWAQADADRLRGAKALFFDRKYAEARAAWQAILAGPKGPDADTAAYWVARCSENLGEQERAFSEYGDFLERRPDAAFAEEARTGRVGIAAKLAKEGKRSYLPVVRQGLSDPSRTVRYYAAFQLSGLPAEDARAAIPVLKKILAEEKDQDLVDRAKLYLIRLDPGALSAPAPGPPARGEAKWLKVRIFNKRETKPAVSVNLPVALAEMLFKSLPDDAKEKLRSKGYDSDNFWERLKKLGPTQVLDIDGEDERVQIWLE